MSPIWQFFFVGAIFTAVGSVGCFRLWLPYGRETAAKIGPTVAALFFVAGGLLMVERPVGFGLAAGAVIGGVAGFLMLARNRRV